MKNKIKEIYKKHERKFQIGALLLAGACMGYFGFKLGKKDEYAKFEEGMEVMECYINLVSNEALAEHPNMKVKDFFKQDTINQYCKKANETILGAIK